MLILDSELSSVLNFLSSYSEADLDILTGSWQRFPISLFSRFRGNHTKVPESGYLPDYGASVLVKEEKIKRFVDFIGKLTFAKNIDLVIPLTESSLIPLSENRRKLKGLEEYPSHDSILSLHDKKLFVEKIKSFLPDFFLVPETFNKDKATFPCFVRPAKGCGSNFSYRCESFEELCKKIDILKRYGREPIIQEFINGNRFAPNLLVDKDYNIVRVYSTTKIHKEKMKKIIPELESFFESIEYYGFASPQFLIKDDEAHIMEINPRLSYVPYGLGFGVRFPEAFFKILSSKEDVKKRFVFMEDVPPVWKSSINYFIRSLDPFPMVKFLFSRSFWRIIHR